MAIVVEVNFKLDETGMAHWGIKTPGEEGKLLVSGHTPVLSGRNEITYRLPDSTGIVLNPMKHFMGFRFVPFIHTAESQDGTVQ